jgi:hypothetical protein
LPDFCDGVGFYVFVYDYDYVFDYVYDPPARAAGRTREAVIWRTSV